MVIALGRTLRWGWVDKRPRGLPASSFVQQLRKHLANARLLGISRSGPCTTLELGRGGAVSNLHLASSPPNLVLEVDGRVLGAASVVALRQAGAAVGQPWPLDGEPLDREGDAPLPMRLERLSELGPSLVDEVLGAEGEARRRRLRKAMRLQLKRLRRRLTAIDGDLAKVAQVEGLRLRGNLLLSNLHTVRDGASEATVVDWVTQRPVTIPIGPGRSARQEADALFKRAGKLERGGQKATERRALTVEQITGIEDVLERAEAAPQDALDSLEREAQRLGVATRRAGGTSTKSGAQRVPYRKFFGTDERPILVGRSAADNDALTQSARSWDRWLHARGVRGSHVIVPLEKREQCPPELLLDAAHLAAHFSSSRGEPIVDVQHCARRYVRKPKGMPPGAVLVDEEKVLAVRVSSVRLQRLLRTEQR